MRGPVVNILEWRRQFLLAAYELSGGDTHAVLTLDRIAEAMGVAPSNPDDSDGLASIARYLKDYGCLWRQYADYGSVSLTASGVSAAEYEASRSSWFDEQFTGIDDLRLRFLGAIYAMAGGNPTQHVSWNEVAPWMGWDRDDLDRFDDAVEIADHLERSGLITVETDARSTYLITEKGTGEVETEPSIAMPPEILAFPPEIDITPDEFSTAAPVGTTPVEILESIERFREDHPDPNKVAFIMMRFGRTRVHSDITDAIRHGLAEQDIDGVRADDKRYHDHVFFNILTYLHGCGLGVAVYDRIEAETYNPNVALEVGYLFAMRKPVCLLKDQTLTTLPTDLVGQLYDPFDPLDARGTIPPVLSKWLSDKGLPAGTPRSQR